MVLPTDHHWALRGWLRSHRVKADEEAGILIIRNLDGLLRLAGSARRLTVEERALVKEGRARLSADPDPLTRLMAQTAGPDDPLIAELNALLQDVCSELMQVGVPAEPALGLGIVFGDELLRASLQVGETARLYELMEADGYMAEPDWDAPPFRQRAWPEPSESDR